MKIRALHILTGHLDKTKEFYNVKLGLPVVEEDGDMIGFNLDQSILYFHKTEAQNPVYHIAFKAPSHTIPAAIQWLNGRAEQIPVKENTLLADFKNWNAEATYFFDNNGNIMELIDRQTGADQQRTSFEASMLTGICEVGIVTGNVSDTCRELSEQFSLELYDKQLPSEHFAAVGDDDGLFIVVSKNRNWFPTGIPSSVFPLAIEFSVNGQEFLLNHPGQGLPFSGLRH